MKKALLIIAIAVLALVPVAAYVLIVNSPARVAVRESSVAYGYQQELTQQQQADLDASFQKMIDLRKETINTMLADGLLTDAQAQLALERLDEMAAEYAENGYAYGYGMMNGCYVGYDLDDSYGSYGGTYGRGMMRGYNWD